MKHAPPTLDDLSAAISREKEALRARLDAPLGARVVAAKPQTSMRSRSRERRQSPEDLSDDSLSDNLVADPGDVLDAGAVADVVQRMRADVGSTGRDSDSDDVLGAGGGPRFDPADFEEEEDGEW